MPSKKLNFFLSLSSFLVLALSSCSCGPFPNGRAHYGTVGESVPIYYKTTLKAGEIKWEAYTAERVSFVVTMENEFPGNLAMYLYLDGLAGLPNQTSLPSDYLGLTSHPEVQDGVIETRVNDAVAVPESDLTLSPGATYKIDFIFAADYFYIPWPPTKNLMRYDGDFLHLESQTQGDYAYFMPENREYILPGFYFMHYGDGNEGGSAFLSSASK